MSLWQVGRNLTILLLLTLVVGLQLYSSRTWPLISSEGDAHTYIATIIGNERGATWQALNEHTPAGNPVQIAVAGNSHAKDAFHALRYTQYGAELDFLPLISNRLCRMDRKEKLLRLFLPRNAATEALHRCTDEFEFVYPTVDTVDGIVLAPLWSDAQVRNLPEFLDEMTARGVPVLVFGNTARFRNVSRGIKSLAARGEARPEVLNEVMSATRILETDLNDRIEQIVRASGHLYLPRDELVCEEGAVCDLTTGPGEFLLFDSGHWTLDGARFFGARLGERPELREFIDLATSADGPN